MLWDETRRVTIASALRAAIERLEALPASDERDKVLALERARLEARLRDLRFTVEVRHVGSPDDPFRYQQLLAAAAAKDHAASVRARKDLLAEGAEVTDEAVAQARARDPQWQADIGEICRGWLTAGLVGGADEALRLWQLGGGDLWLEAAREVRAYQEPDGPFSIASAPGSGAGSGTTALHVAETDSSSTTARVAA